MSPPAPLGPSDPMPRLADGFVPDRPDLGHAAEGWDLADAAFFADARGPTAARLLPPAAYRALAFADLEDDAVWTRSWLCVGVRDEIPAPGDLLPFTAGHHGIHVQREAEGSLVGRFNKAQHGGCRAVPLQCQTGTKTRCSFTACGYSRDGDPLAAAPDGGPTPAMHQYLGLRPERLLPVAVRAVGPLIFTHLDRAASASPCDVPLPRTAALRTADGAAMHRVELAANWKLVLAALAEGERIVPDAAPWSGIGHRADGVPVRVRLFFPNLVVLSAADGGCAIVLQPTALGRTLCRMAVFGAEAAWEPWLAEITLRGGSAMDAQRSVASVDAADAELPAPNGAALWLQDELAARILSRPDAGLTEPLYATAQGRRG